MYFLDRIFAKLKRRWTHKKRWIFISSASDLYFKLFSFSTIQSLYWSFTIDEYSEAFQILKIWANMKKLCKIKKEQNCWKFGFWNVVEFKGFMVTRSMINVLKMIKITKLKVPFKWNLFDEIKKWLEQACFEFFMLFQNQF